MRSRSATHVDAEFVHTVLDGGLHVTLLFGRPSAPAARRLVAILDRESFTDKRWSLFDASAVQAIAPDAFGVLTEYQNRRRADLAAIVARQAIVSPPGLAGAIVTGYRAVFEFSYPVEFFTERSAALAYLGRAEALAAVDKLAALGTTHPIVHGLREELARTPTLELAAAARKLSVSVRSLQRHLAGAGTSYLDEVRAARIAAAKHALVETDRKLEAIAREVGCASLQSFSATFRRATGETPSAFRARARNSGTID